jgi:hypothetical protein
MFSGCAICVDGTSRYSSGEANIGVVYTHKKAAKTEKEKLIEVMPNGMYIGKCYER